MWLHGKPALTVKRYVFWVEDFFETVEDKPLHLVTLDDLHRWQDTLERYAPATQRNAIASIKSLFTFCFELGILRFNVGKAVKPPKVKDTLNERILTETEVQKMIAMEPNSRNVAILKMLYYGALRVSELVALKWRDVSVRPEGGQITVHGKGEKTRMVLLPGRVWDELLMLRGEASENDPIFRSRQHKNGGHLDPSRVTKIVRGAAKRAELGQKVSPHWLRHCHASHALDRNAPVHLIRDTLGHSSLATTSRYLKGRPKESSATFLPL
ncbi:tyrosine-type recombinase/integrase [Oscillatoriales cyanobacterium LEGE 11467]|uniref:Tyrosine-type recombinase/integrase n=2 Tax=Zarconia TaxID=2992130 RepID=A0A928VUV7_9CYAN|nr:tyrosine-type recombinase/integrase [Zarconia navalis LEGE 11467]